MENSARLQYDQEIQSLEHDLLEMASRAETMVAAATEALIQLDEAKARSVFALDDSVDEHESDLEARCLRLIALHAPTASDLRTIGTVLKVITDLERIGDLAVDIARIVLKVEQEFGETRIIDWPRISGLCRQMLRQAMGAFVKRDLAMVQQVISQDDEVDALYRELREQVHNNMRLNPDKVVSDGWLLLSLHHFERIADHSVNIAERVGFMVTGQLKEHVRHSGL